MDLITTGRSAADRGRIEQLSACRRRRSFVFPQPAAAAAAAAPGPADDAGANAPAGTELSGLLADRRRDAFSANEIGAELRERMNMDVSADDVRPLSPRAPCQPRLCTHVVAACLQGVVSVFRRCGQRSTRSSWRVWSGRPAAAGTASAGIDGGVAAPCVWHFNYSSSICVFGGKATPNVPPVFAHPRCEDPKHEQPKTHNHQQSLTQESLVGTRPLDDPREMSFFERSCLSSAPPPLHRDRTTGSPTRRLR